ncbi:MAG: T9SS type A sorting domain-containing protein [Bacteroidota bacterium]
MLLFNKTTFTIPLLALSFHLSAQEAFVCMGGELAHGSSEITFSIGQLMNEQSADGIQLHVGVQYPFEQSTLALDSKGDIDLNYLAFPNPTMDQVYITISNFTEEVHYELSDFAGKLILKGTWTSATNTINMAEFAFGIYHLNLFSNTHQPTIVPIIKN